MVAGFSYLVFSSKNGTIEIMPKEVLSKVEESWLRIDCKDKAFALIDADNLRLVIWDPEEGRLGLNSPNSVMEFNEDVSESDLVDFLSHLTSKQYNLIQEGLSELGIESLRSQENYG